MTIEIITADLTEEIEGITLWAIWIEITQLSEVYLLPVTAPGSLPEVDLQSHLEAQETALFVVAQQKQILPETIYEKFISGRVLKAFAALVLDEINILRTEAGLVVRTAEQLRTAIKIKLQE